MLEVHKNVVKSFAYLAILIELSKGKKLSGYDIVVHVRKFGLEAHPGTVYHQLGMLSRRGVIRGEKQNNKTVYEFTDEGLKAYKRFKKKWRKPLKYAHQNIVGF